MEQEHLRSLVCYRTFTVEPLLPRAGVTCSCTRAPFSSSLKHIFHRLFQHVFSPHVLVNRRRQTSFGNDSHIRRNPAHPNGINIAIEMPLLPAIKSISNSH